MKKVLFVAMMMLVSVGVAGVTPLLVEAYQEGTITIPEDETDTLTVVEVSFSVDTSCYVLFTAGGQAKLAKLWLELNGDKLPHEVRLTSDEHAGALTFDINFTYPLDPGEQTISLCVTDYYPDASTRCLDSYLQALIFLPDTATGAVAEQPMSDAQPTGNTPSLISKGPFVHAPGATELVDASGRVIENAITDERVYLSTLPTGTYFARNGERTIVKIVKVD